MEERWNVDWCLFQGSLERGFGDDVKDKSRDVGLKGNMLFLIYVVVTFYWVNRVYAATDHEAKNSSDVISGSSIKEYSIYDRTLLDADISRNKDPSPQLQKNRYSIHKSMKYNHSDHSIANKLEQTLHLSFHTQRLFSQ